MIDYSIFSSDLGTFVDSKGVLCAYIWNADTLEIIDGINGAGLNDELVDACYMLINSGFEFILDCDAIDPSELIFIKDNTEDFTNNGLYGYSDN